MADLTWMLLICLGRRISSATVDSLDMWMKNQSGWFPLAWKMKDRIHLLLLSIMRQWIEPEK